MSTSRCSCRCNDNVLVTVVKLIAILVTLLISAVLIYNFLFVAKIFTPSCPRVYERVCNGRGVCGSSGLCECDTLYSNSSCVDNQVPGYDLPTNQECNGNGYAYPFIIVPAECQQQLVLNELVGEGWGSMRCKTYVDTVRQVLAARGGNPTNIPAAWSIPICMCNPGYTGVDCSIKACPVGENLNICSSHGNTSVGIYKNGTDAGLGCQCSTKVGWFQDQYRVNFNQQMLTLISTTYYREFNQLYCGQVITYSPAVNVTLMYLYQNPISYSCFCDDNYVGLACDEGKCPANPQTDEVCNGNGHPLHGQGLLTNTTKRRSRGKKCNILCQSGFTACGKRCAPDQSTEETIYSQGAFCNSPTVAQIDKPVKCYDGSLVPIPGPTSHGCTNNYVTGSIDISQINLMVRNYVCANITNGDDFTECFQNTTDTVGVSAYYDPFGIVWNPNYTLTVDLGSPMVYLEFSTNASTVVLNNWNGEQYVFTETPLIAQMFNYEFNNQGNWLPVDSGVFYVTNTSTQYVICPMPWNYSAGLIYPANYSRVRLLNADADLTYIFNAISSTVNVTSYQNTSYVLVRRQQLGQPQPLWYYPSGVSATDAECLSEPSACSWYVDENFTTIRSLDLNWYICELAGVPFVTQVACTVDMFGALAEYLFSWNSCLVGLPEFPINEVTFEMTSLERNYTQRTSYPVNITFIDVSQNYTMLDIVLLSQDRVTFPCACQPNSQTVNQTLENEFLFSDAVLRDIDTVEIEIGQWVLAAEYSSGSRRLLRAQVIAVNIDAESLVVYEPWLQETFSVFARDARQLLDTEVVSGWPDPNLLLQPFKCPDGRGSSATSQLLVIDTSCNCTYASGVTQCSCTDQTKDKWGCTCYDTVEYCECGFPATPSYEIALWDVVSQLNVDQCTCLIFTPTEEQLLNSSVTVTGLSTREYVFLYDLNQVPTGLYLHFSSACTGLEVYLTSGSFLFTNITQEQQFTSVQDGCELWTRIYLDQLPAYSSLNVSSNKVFDSASLLFSTSGYDLLASNQSMIFTASSNSANASLVNYPNGTSGWLSTGSEIPTWIQVEFETNLFVDYSLIVFSQLGVQNVTTRVFLQGWTNSTWFNLGNVSAWVGPGGWLQTALVTNSSTSYSKYRLINPAGAMGIRQWSLFSNQQCSCPSQPHAHTFLRLSDTGGLETISDLLDQIRIFNESVNVACCSCVDNCEIFVGEEVLLDFANDGICEDAQFVANNLGLPPQLIQNGEFLLNMSLVNVTTGLNFSRVSWGVVNGLNAVQFSTYEPYLLSDSELVDFYETQFPFGVTYIGLNAADQGNNFTVVLNVYFFNDLFEVQVASPTPFAKLYYLNDSVYILQQTFNFSYDYLVQQRLACATGNDCTDCGPACRSEPFLPGINCGLTQQQLSIQNAIVNTSILITRGYYASNFSQLTNSWSFVYNNITVPRTVVQLGLNNCPLQTCDIHRPFMCDDGSCVRFRTDCTNRYNCPANGCVKVPGASSQGFNVYRCACAPGHGGDGCQYKQTVAATPYLEFGVAGAETTHCQGPCPLRVHPGFKLDRVLSFEELETFNMRTTYNSAPKSPRDLDYHLLMPICSPYGQVVRYKYVMPDPSGLLSVLQRTIWTDCPPLRKGYHGEYKNLRDDVQGRNPVDGEPVWRVYTNPVTGAEETFPWLQGITSYMDFPFRCSNGDCAANEVECTRAVQLRPTCNGRGQCLADGSCGCDLGYKTNLLTEAVALEARYPYPVVNGVPDPTLWVMSDKWRTFAYSQCTARDCDVVDCGIPLGCFPGTPELGFVDKLELCLPETGRPNRCAPSQLDCRAGINIQLPIKCSGNGIPRQKDFTGEFYCACGTPDSEDLTVGEASELTQLKKNGWAGPTCNEYFARTVPIVWSSWDFTRNQQYTSRITGELLPGVWLAGVAPVGPDPADRTIWETCCPGYSRLEYCPNVPCSVLGKIVCMESSQCLPPNVPLVYRCNNHGLARADGTCLCNTNIDNGDGYTSDFTQFSIDGCYQYVKCPLSEINQEPCNVQPACSQPGNWLHPLSYTPYFEQQWWVCLGGQGLYNNITRLGGISTSSSLFRQQLIQGLGDVASRTQAAIDGLQGCVCIYPTDTPTSATAMIPGTSLIYKQSFKFPFLLPVTGTSTYPGKLYSSGYGSFVWTPGNYQLLVSIPGNYTISAVRIFGKPVSSAIPQFTFKDHLTGLSICRSSPVPFFNSTSDLLNWGLGSLGGALYCGPTYKCLDFRSEYPVDYFIYCLVPDSVACISWKEQTCLETPTNEPWPIDSLSSFQECNRDEDRDPGGCTCCKLVNLFAGTGQLTSDTIRVTVSDGAVRISQLEFYGYATTSQTAPVKLKTELDTKAGKVTTCQDDRMFREYLGPDGNYFIPRSTTTGKQVVTNAATASFECKQNGGYLAWTFDTIVQSSVSQLQNACNRITNASGCYVAAQETKFEKFTTPRNALFQDNGGCFNNPACTFYSCQICYETSLLSNAYPITFSTFPTAPVGVSVPSFLGTANTSFTVPMFPDQVSSKDSVYRMGPSSATSYGVSAPYIYPKTTGYCRIFFGKSGANPPEIEVLLLNPSVMDPFTVLHRVGVFFKDNEYSYDWDYVRVEPQFCVTIQFVRYNSANNFCNAGTSAKDMYLPNRGPYYTLTPGYWEADGPLSAICGSYVPGRGKWDAPCDGVYQRGSCLYKYHAAKDCNMATDRFGNLRQEMVVDNRNVYPTCFKILPGPTILPDVPGDPFSFNYVWDENIGPIAEYTFDPSKTRKSTSGTFGIDWLPGVDQYPFLPVFVEIKERYNFQYNVFSERDNNKVIQAGDQPIYFTAYPGAAHTEAVLSKVYKKLPNLQKCNQCIRPLTPILQWMPQRFQTNTWVNIFESTTARLYLQLLVNGPGASFSWIGLPLTTDLALRYHQVTFYQPRNVYTSSATRLYLSGQNSRVDWEFNSCGYVNSLGFQLAVCSINMNYICSYDYTKFTVLSGTQGDQCGPNTRSGGAPLPGVTCFDEFPLANATAYPLQHEILRQSQSNTLDLYVDDFNLPTDTVDFGNNSIIWGYREAWLKWKADFSNRPGQSSRGVEPQLDFCDLSLTGNFPVDCGLQRNPTTKVLEQWCASNTEFCNLNEVAPPEPLMRTGDIPPLFRPSDVVVAASDPTCGYPVKLSSFFQIDEWGKEQDDLDLYNRILQQVDSLIQIQILSPLASWYNAGKTPYKYVFQANTTSTVAGRYRLDGCAACVSPLMEIILYPLNEDYRLTDPILKFNVSMVKGVTSNFQVTFAVTETDTGVRFVNGERFPIYTFRGIGYRFYNLDVGSTVLLFNPVITNSETIAECTSRELPAYVEPPVRIKSSAPIRKCILTQADQLLFPGKNIGQCGCDISSGDTNCDCPKVLTQLGSLTCGGVGSAGTRVQGPDGQFYQTRETETGAGCYVWGPDKISDCKTVNVGTAVWTLLTPGAVWDPPSVTVDASPVSGASIFINPDPDVTWQTVDNVTELCLVSAARLPYYFTADELDQLVSVNKLGRKPILMGVGEPTGTTYPWSAVPDTYFINNLTGTFIATETDLVCSAEPGLCLAVNWNNLAYLTTGINITDGNVKISSTFYSPGEITYSTAASQSVLVVVFGTGTVSCTGGVCGAGTAGVYSTSYPCNCPLRIIQYTAGDYSEIQIFEQGDLARSSIYNY